jgi:DNA-binding IclR family transcriptional regulator
VSKVGPVNNTGMIPPGAMAAAFVGPLARGLSVLSAFGPADNWLGNIEIAARTGLPTPTANRLAKSLVSLGYLQYTRRGRKYRLAPAVLSVGYAAVLNIRVREIARLYMQRLADENQLFVLLGERDRLNMVIVENCSSASSVLALKLDVGSRVPIASTALGWALLWALPASEREYLLTHIQWRERETWPNASRMISQAFQQLDKLGFCTSVGAWRSEITTVATPIVSADGASIVAMGYAAPRLFLPKRRILVDVGPRLLAAAEELKSSLRGVGEKEQ